MKELQEEIDRLNKEIAIDKKNEEIEAIEEEKEEVEKTYEEMLSDKAVYQEADRLLTEGHMDEMLTLLESYSQDYSDIGHLLGENFTESFNEEIKNALDALDLLKNEKNKFETPDEAPTTPPPSTSNPPTTTTPSPTNNNGGGKTVSKGSRVKINNPSDAIYVDSYASRSSGTWKGAGVSSSDTLYVVNDNNGRVALSRTNSIYGAIGWIDKKKVSAFASGGYTGDFSGGKLGVLHSKERVLSAEQTRAFDDLVYKILPQLQALPTILFDKLLNNSPTMNTMRESMSNTINNEWNITNNTPLDVDVMEKDLEKVFKSELRKFGKISR